MDSLPPGWNTALLKDGIKLISGQHILAEQYSSEPVGMPYLTGPADFPNGKIVVTKYTTAPQQVCEAGDILITVKGSGTGKLVRADQTYCISRQLMAIRPTLWNREFIYHYLDFHNKRYTDAAAGLIPGITRDDVLDTPILVPPLAEQRKIAAILGTWDAAIATVEQLIAALQVRKQGLMQRLLTGEVRFPEFAGSEWERKKFSEVFERVSRKNTIGSTNVLTASAQHGLVSQVEYFNRSVAGADLANYYLLKKGEFAYNRSSSDGYPFGAIKQLERYEEGILSTLYICFRMIDGAGLSDFYKHYFESGGLNQGIYMIAQEGARNHGLLNVGLSDFFDLDVVAPPLEEQQRIAEVFELQERLIDTAKRRYAAMIQQKQALMQQLLTGQVRVNVADEPILTS